MVSDYPVFRAVHGVGLVCWFSLQNSCDHLWGSAWGRVGVLVFPAKLL